jgi:hypothetical protein
MVGPRGNHTTEDQRQGVHFFTQGNVQMTKNIDHRYLQQDPDHDRWLKRFFNLVPYLQYHMANQSEYCLTFEASMVDDERPLFQWIVDHGGLPIVDPKQNYWYGKGVFWFPNQRSRWYAIQTAEAYLVRDWWWKYTFDTNCEAG